MRFPYELYPSKKGSVFLPTLNISIANVKTKQTFYNYKVLVDSGSAGCVFHSVIGEIIGINISRERKISLTGATGTPKEQFVHPVSLIIGTHTIEAGIGFSYHLKVPFGLLGQRGFFDRFKVCFDLPTLKFENTSRTHHA